LSDIDPSVFVGFPSHNRAIEHFVNILVNNYVGISNWTCSRFLEVQDTCPTN